jgi:uncharacterized membrane protein
MLYAWIKIFHIISASVLFGTGLGTAFYMFYVNLQQNVGLIAKATTAVVIADWLFTATAGVVQAVTGFILVWLKGYALSSLWLVGSIAGYIVAGVCWLPVVWLQMQCRDMAIVAEGSGAKLPAKYYRYFYTWCSLGVPAFIALITVFYLMGNRPETLF